MSAEYESLSYYAVFRVDETRKEEWLDSGG